jgi:peptide/nickel transport system ATP-binding protein
MPRLDQERLERLIPIKGTPPSLINVPSGCAFHPRCRYAGMTDGRSQTEVPAPREVEPGHLVACHLTADQRRAFRAEQVLEETEASIARATQGDV